MEIEQSKNEQAEKEFKDAALYGDIPARAIVKIIINNLNDRGELHNAIVKIINQEVDK